MVYCQEFEKRIWGELDNQNMANYLGQQLEMTRLRDEMVNVQSQIDRERQNQESVLKELRLNLMENYNAAGPAAQGGAGGGITGSASSLKQHQSTIPTMINNNNLGNNVTNNTAAGNTGSNFGGAKRM